LGVYGLLRCHTMPTIVGSQAGAASARAMDSAIEVKRGEREGFAISWARLDIEGAMEY